MSKKINKGIKALEVAGDVRVSKEGGEFVVTDKWGNTATIDAVTLQEIGLGVDEALYEFLAEAGIGPFSDETMEEEEGAFA